MRRVFTESVLFLVLATALALGANALSEQGLELDRDYFPRGAPPAAAPAAQPGPARPGPQGGTQSVVARIQEYGFQIASEEDVAALSSLAGEEGVYLLDARRRADFEAGHVPGATLCDHYQSHKYLPALLPGLREAIQVVIYCHGGTCEDSLFLALDLLKKGVPQEVISVFPGGMEEWTELGRPVVKGP